MANTSVSTSSQANTYNVEIFEPGPPDQTMDTMELTLLSRKRHHEALDGYSAPSQESPRSVPLEVERWRGRERV